MVAAAVRHILFIGRKAFQTAWAMHVTADRKVGQSGLAARRKRIERDEAVRDPNVGRIQPGTWSERVIAGLRSLLLHLELTDQISDLGIFRD